MNVGDTVIVTKTPDSVFRGLNKDIKVGDIGVICSILEKKYGVERYGVDWGRPVEDGHSCSGACASGYGYFIDKRCVSMIESNEPEFAFNEDDFKEYILMTGGESHQ